ncbi:peptidoglycan DD-metalloendopeptidase family protein [Nitratireductor sp. B36]|uniref:peptidoglycan DD-metalloendopeptidase family protein n=1 Tax=Nitratireductor sp. B36 TaxID=2762059 RepID=UPI001E6373D3|nr:peptidoglycan DD-metalloendopeptidase family protein [Nitratireductor sp. B36]MCC5779531.1 peptidoglycan DD-metalloendopeptidase family protein [Nitratireductor sp. B36]
MRCIARNFDRALLRGAAVILIGGVAAGCSSDLSRFKSSDFADARSTNRSVAMTPASQPYPGDTASGLDTTYTGSISRQGGGPRPSASVGGAMQQPLPAPTNTAARAATRPVDLTAPSAASGSVQRQPIAAPTQTAPAVAAAPQPKLDRTPTGSIARQSAQAPARSGNSGDSGWSDVGGTTITVREGETAYNLSRRFGVPVGAILSANNLSSASELKAGRQIVIPTYVYSRRAPVSAPDNDARASQQAARQPIPNEPAPQREPQERLAVLRETPRPKSRPQGAETNNAAANTHSAGGRTATSPVTSSAGGTYTVVSGDTLYGIARKTGASVGAIKAANGLSDGYLRVGQTLAIPSGNGGEQSQVASVTQQQVDKTTTSATTRETTPTVKASAPQAASSTQTQVAAVATQSNDVAPDSTGIGKLRWPVRGRIISDFGSTSGSARNDGIDIAVPAGTPVKAAENGVVIYAGDGLKEFGNTVLVRHDDGMVTVYGHASALRVKRGEKVRRGQEIALSGMSGSADRPKLHFEVRKDATPVNPSGYLE